MARRTAGAPVAVIYCRVSTAGQADAVEVEVGEGRNVSSETSVDTQEAAGRAYAAEQGWIVEKVYRDTFSGHSLMERPDLTALRERVAAGGIDHVIVYGMDRLSRKMGVVAFLNDELGDADCELAFVTERYSNDSTGRLLQAFQEWRAEAEREGIKERTTRGKRAKVKAGALLTGCRPRYGYRWTNQVRGKRTRFEIDPDTGPIVQQVFTWAAQGASMRSIANRLTAMQVPTPTRRGTTWAHVVIREMLEDDQYLGRAMAFRRMSSPARSKRTGKKFTRLSVRPADQQIALPEGTIPALVNPATFAVVQQRLERNKAESTRNNKHPERTLLRAGFIVCGHCGRAMVVENKTGNYRCGVNVARGVKVGDGSPTIAAHIADPAAWERVRTVLLDCSVIEREVERRAADDGATERDVQRIAKLVDELDRKQKNLIANLGLLDPESAGGVRVELKALSDQRRALEAERAEAQVRHERRQEVRARLQGIAAWQDRVARNLDNLDYQGKRDALTALGLTMRVWRKAGSRPRWEITLNIDPEQLVEGSR